MKFWGNYKESFILIDNYKQPIKVTIDSNFKGINLQNKKNIQFNDTIIVEVKSSEGNKLFDDILKKEGFIPENDVSKPLITLSGTNTKALNEEITSKIQTIILKHN